MSHYVVRVHVVLSGKRVPKALDALNTTVAPLVSTGLHQKLRGNLYQLRSWTNLEYTEVVNGYFPRYRYVNER